MEILLRKDQATSLAGLGIAASKDKNRPTLRVVFVEAAPFQPDHDQDKRNFRVTFTVTDSYRLAQQAFIVEATGDIPTEPFAALFDAHQLVSILKKAKAKSDRVLVTIVPGQEFLPAGDGQEEVPYRKPLMEVRVFTNAGNLSCEIEFVDATFPKYSQLVDLDLIDKNWNEETQIKDRGAHCSFNPTYLSQMAEALGAKGSGVPVQVLLNGSMKPALFKWVRSGEGTSWGVLMPVRI